MSRQPTKITAKIGLAFEPSLQCARIVTKARSTRLTSISTSAGWMRLAGSAASPRPIRSSHRVGGRMGATPGVSCVFLRIGRLGPDAAVERDALPSALRVSTYSPRGKRERSRQCGHDIARFA